MYVRRLRWAGEILKDLEAAGVNSVKFSKKSFLRESNSILIDETDGLSYLKSFYDALFKRLDIDFRVLPSLQEHYHAFFESSQARIDRLKKEGAAFISDINSFRRVFQSKSGITISTIHGVKGAEFDTVIAYALLEDMVPHFNDTQDSAKRLLYVISSRARKNLHLISETERFNYSGNEYTPTLKLLEYVFAYSPVP